MSLPPPDPSIPTVRVPPPPPLGGAFPPRAITEADRAGLRKISNGAVIGGVGGVISLTVAEAISASGFTRALELRAGFSSGPNWIAPIGLLAFAILLSLVQLTWTRAGLRGLPGPSPELDSPLRLSILAYPGLLLILVGVPVVLLTLGSVLTCHPPGPPGGAMPCVQTGALWPVLVGAALIVVGAILSVIGWIYLAIGLWRLERRYHESLIQVGAVLLLLFPLLGDILLWVGIRAVRKLPTVPAPPSG